MKKLITQIDGPTLFWVGLLIVAIIMIVVFLTGNDGGHGHAH